MTFDAILSIDPSLLCGFLRRYDGEILSSALNNDALATYDWPPHDPVVIDVPSPSALVHLPQGEMVIMANNFICYCGEEGEMLCLWKWMESGKPGKLYIGGLAYDHARDLIIVLDTFRNHFLLYTKRGKLVRTVLPPRVISPRSLLLLPNGSWLVRTNDDEGDVMVWTIDPHNEQDIWSTWEHTNVIQYRMGKSIHLLSTGFVYCDPYTSATPQLHAFDHKGVRTWTYDMPMDTVMYSMVTLPNDHTIMALYGDTTSMLYMKEIDAYGHDVRTILFPEHDWCPPDPVHLSVHQGSLYVCDERNERLIVFYDVVTASAFEKM